MKFLRSKFIFFFLASFFLFVLPLKTFAQANSFNRQKIVILDKNQIVNHDYFTAGSQVVIDGTINGDAYVAGGQVDVNGIINGDLLVAGGQIDIRGNVSQNIRAVGGNVVIEGNAGKNVSIVAGNLTIYKTAKITGNTVIAGGNARIDGNILGNFTAGIGTLDIMSDAMIRGSLNYWSNNNAIIEPSARIVGQTNFYQEQFQTGPRKTIGRINRVASCVKAFFTVYGLITSLILGLLFIWLLPVFTQKTVDLIKNKFWFSVLIGFVTLIVIPVVGIIFAVTVLGIPIALVLMFVYFVLIYIAKIFISLTIGKFIAEKAKWHMNSYWAFVLGIFIYYIVGFVPVVGGLMKIFATFAGIGAILIQKKTDYLAFREKKLI